MPPKRQILVVDDEKDILKLVQYNLEKEGYQVLTAKTGEEGFETARQSKPDLVILDLMLPGIDGLEVCKMLRADGAMKRVPILMLTAKGSETDQIVGLELGATDYIVKPFSVKVLLARVKNIFRNQGIRAHSDDRPVLRSRDMVLDKEKQSFTVAGKPIQLTSLEFRILAFLMENRGKVFSRERLLDGVWKGESFVIDRTVDVHMRSIRQKLGRRRNAIETVRGTGYRFAEDDL
jgi:DNA-binding response OmpR family regulator